MRINGAAVRAIREAQGWKITGLARACGITHAYLSNIEAGRRRSAAPDVVRSLADVLQVQVRAIAPTYTTEQIAALDREVQKVERLARQLAKTDGHARTLAEQIAEQMLATARADTPQEGEAGEDGETGGLIRRLGELLRAGVAIDQVLGDDPKHSQGAA